MVDLDRLRAAVATVRCDLLAERDPAGRWVGRLASSPLATATSIAALAVYERHAAAAGRSVSADWSERISRLILRGLNFLVDSQNEDGGWGDTDKSVSNLATTILARSAFALTALPAAGGAMLERADAYIASAGGVTAVRRRYGHDRSFAAPVLAMAALAGLVEWRDVPALPFELAALPPTWWRRLRLPVVSHAIPLLVAVGQVRNFFHKPINPFARLIRKFTAARTLAVMQEQQPEGGGFMEAPPLTGFIVMSLAAMDRPDHPVAARGVEFLLNTARCDGSWAINVDLSIWNTALAAQALAHGDEFADARPLDWLLECQQRQTHPYTCSPPGGWAWTDRPGGLPDADDTSAALLALVQLRRPKRTDGALRLVAAGDGNGEAAGRVGDAANRAARWLLELQNTDGGWPTFCRGWGTLPFDRSGADLTARALRALAAWRADVDDSLMAPIDASIARGLDYLWKNQFPDGAWRPLWFGNQFEPDESNPVYGTAQVLLALADLNVADHPLAQRGLDWLVGAQNPDAGWGGGPWRARARFTGNGSAAQESPPKAAPSPQSSVEETALAVEALEAASSSAGQHAARDRGLQWLLDAVAADRHAEPSPIGFYFAKLWYYEQLYPLIFTAAALGRAGRRLLPNTSPQATMALARQST